MRPLHKHHFWSSVEAKYTEIFSYCVLGSYNSTIFYPICNAFFMLSVRDFGFNRIFRTIKLGWSKDSNPADHRIFYTIFRYSSGVS